MASNYSLSRLNRADSFKQKKFDYGNIDNETKAKVEQRASEIKSLIRQTAQDIVCIGQKLTEVKGKLKHGSFRNWLKAEFNWSLSSATKFMQVSEQFKDVIFTNLNFSTSALYILAAPSTPEAARKQALKLASQGEQITYSLAKIIVNHYKDVGNEQMSHRDKAKTDLQVDDTALKDLPTFNINREWKADREVANTNSDEHPLHTINVSAQAVTDEVVRKEVTQKEQLQAAKSDRRVTEEGLQNFKISYASVSFMVLSKPEEITTLFEQMQNNSLFAREVFAKAQLLLSSNKEI